MRRARSLASELHRLLEHGLGRVVRASAIPARRITDQWASTPSLTRSLLRRHDRDPMDSSVTNVWTRRKEVLLSGILRILCVFVTYLVSELVIWGLSRALSPARIAFFSPIMSMILVFATMTVVYALWKPVQGLYKQRIKPVVDFINAHLGVGFPVPIVMLNENEVLDGKDIARVLGNAILTNAISWLTVFGLSLLVILVFRHHACSRRVADDTIGLQQPLTARPPRVEINWYSSTNSKSASHEKPSRPGTATPPHPPSTGTNGGSTTSTVPYTNDISPRFSLWDCLITICPIFLALSMVSLVGVPIAASTGDTRFLDAFVIWLVWIIAVTVQRAFKHSHKFPEHRRTKSVIATMLNPVLMTTLLMIGYTRLKSQAMLSGDLAKVLEQFSSSTPLYQLWTSLVTGEKLGANPQHWFGAGDAALSLLECGIFIWGFKLFECRQQLFSAAGLLTILLATAAAVGNVFLSVLAASSMGLGKPEALAFAARSVTLALAKPAMESLGGNKVVNAALVVGNGILGQLLYPFVLDKLGVKYEYGDSTDTGAVASANQVPNKNDSVDNLVHEDDALTVAAGIAVGVNGAAMGVAYLYEMRSRAASYAALSMTVFGVITVVLTTVSPFKESVISLASY